MAKRSRRAVLRATVAATVGGTLGGCVAPAVDTLQDNCTEDERTDGPATADGTGRWTGYGAGPDNAASTTASGPNDPELAWRYATCDGQFEDASPLVADGRAYVTDTVSGARAFDAATGERLWSDEAPGRAPRQSYADGTLYVVQGGLLARDGSDGTIEWTFAPGDASTPDADDGGRPSVVAAPTVDDGTVFVVAGVAETRLVALDATDGTVMWNERIADEIRSSAPTVGSDAVYVAGAGSELLALDRETGAVRWTTTFEERVEASTVAGGRLYVTTRSTLHALSLDGDTNYTVPTGVTTWDVAVDAERLYVTDHSILAALDVETGDSLWETENTDEAGETRGLGKPVVGESSVYVGQADPDGGDGPPQAAIYAFDKGSGDRMWRFDTRGISTENGGPELGTREQIAVGDGTLYFTTGAGDLYAVADG